MHAVEEIETDLLIIGAGGAGMMAALHALQTGQRPRVLIAVKGLPGQSGCTRMVQGGFNAVLHPDDSCEKHFLDTVKGGAWINHQELAWTLVKEAPERILELENRAGCLFDRNPDGTIHQKPFAGQSFDRTVHKGDLTGIEIMSNLRDSILESGARVLQETRGLDLLMDGGRAGGALLLDIRTGRFIAVRAQAVLLATGGGATMYKISSPSLEKSGDGMGMAIRAGASLLDMEMLQFHPTGLLVGGSVATGGLLEEGLRGAGARLYNGLGERYMERYDPETKERATRDVISRSSFLEIRAGRGTPHGGVWIDVSHLGARFLLKNFPGMVERCRDYGFDLLHDRVEVSPTAHYQMGGVRMDVDGKTSLEGLFVAGEDGAGVHGANRLGGNGVADSIVFGARAGDAMAAYAGCARTAPVSRAQVDELCRRWTAPLTGVAVENPFAIRLELRNVMWEHAGIVRHASGLDLALQQLKRLEERTQQARVAGAAASNPAWNEILDLTNMIATGTLVARSALLRTESRGAHYREDYPRPDAGWLSNILWEQRDGEWQAALAPVRFTRLAPPELEHQDADHLRRH
ncbi:MAG: FAD-binding protein [Acidobacteria bacterium]|nr:FAD-binding protein [Acidobacteriota bacterium]